MRLNWANQGGIVTVTPENRDRFALTVRRAVKACRDAVAEDEFGLQLDILLKRLAEWLARRDDVRSAYFTMRDGRFVFLTVRRAAEHDPAFEDSLSELDIEIANDPALERIRMDTIALPPVSDDTLSSFLDPQVVFTYRGQRS